MKKSLSGVSQQDRCLLSILSYSFGQDADAFPRYTAEEWRQLFEDSCRHSLVGVLFEGIQRLQKEDKTLCPLLLKLRSSSIDFGRLLGLSESAVWLWKQAGEQGDFTVESLAEALCEEYDISPERAVADVSRLVEQWQEEGLVEP